MSSKALIIVTASVPESTRRAGRREWIGLGLLALPAVLVAMDMTVLHLAVPSLSADLRPTGSQLLWIVDIYGLMIAGFLITMGDEVGDSPEHDPGDNAHDASLACGPMSRNGATHSEASPVD